MTCPVSTSVVRRKSSSFSQLDLMIPPKKPRRSEPVAPASNPLERLAQLVIANDRLIDELTRSRARIVAALTYLDEPGCHARFGSAHLERCRDRHAAILAELRANRIEALQLLGHESKPAE